MNLSERYQKKLNEEIEKVEEKKDGVLVQIEVTNVCNHKCIFCPNVDSSRKKKMMDFEFAKRIIKECAEFLGEDKKICFHMNGEPLLYKQLPELVAYSKQMGYDYSFITTNGSVANAELLKKLFEAGLDSIKFSINAGCKDSYKKIHGVDDFEKVIEALKFSWRYRKDNKKNYKIFVSCVGIKDNYSELVALNDLVGQYSDEVVFYYPCAYAGQKIQKTKELHCDLESLPLKTFEIKHTIPCAVLWNSINVTCEGYLSLCCSESDNRLIVEDLNKMSVKEAWLGTKMTRIREMHLAGNINDMPCYSCVYEEEYNAKEINEELFELSLMH